MSLQSTNWHAIAIAFAKANNTHDVALMEKAIRHGAGIVVDATAERIKTATTELREKRERANAPQ